MQAFAGNPWLRIGVTDTNDYGNGINGIRDHIKEAAFDFVSGQGVRLLTVRGYDIDTTNEVKVIVNGNEIGTLETSSNNRFSTTQLTIPAFTLSANQVNTISFVQRNRGAIWGVTDLQLSDLPELMVGAIDTTSYGKSYAGAIDRLYRADFAIRGKPSTSTDLHVIGYDIDSSTEISVLLNDVRVGYLQKSSNNGFQNTEIQIPRSSYKTGKNVLSFVQKNKGARWGVSDIELIATEPQPSTQLTLGVANEGKFGYSFDGVLTNPIEVTLTFTNLQSTPIEVLTLDINGYDIDSEQEVLVYVNNQLIGNLHESPNNGISLTTLPIQIDEQVTGTNRIKIVQRNNGARWGVTDVMLIAGCNYPLVIVN